MKSLFSLVFAAAILTSNSIAAPASIENGDSAVSKCLEANPGSGASDLLAYAKTCERVNKKFPNATMRAVLYKRIGDTYYDIDHVRQAEQWHFWYKKAAKTDPALKNSTPVGYRLQEYFKIALRKWCVRAAFIMYMLLLAALVFRAVKSRYSFDMRFFAKWTLVFFCIFSVGSVVVFLTDARSFTKTGPKLLSPNAVSSSDPSTSTLVLRPIPPIVNPVIPFGIIDSSRPGRSLLVFLLGFVPVAFAVLYRSFRKPYSRLNLSVLVILAVVSIWGHFFAITVFDGMGNPINAVTKIRVLYSGEPEKLLLTNFPKALKANPDLLKSNNEDLSEFMENHYPNGFLHNKQ